MGLPVRTRNDPRQYEDLADAWWDRGGVFAMLHWLAAARAELLPRARPGDVLVDVACGGGLMAPFAAGAGYRHVGVDLGVSAVRTARAAGVLAVQGDARGLPLADACARVVVAGEVLEHVRDVDGVVGEVCRVLAPGGTVVLDTVVAGALSRLVAVTVAERMPGGPPPRLHDPDLFVDPVGLRQAFARHGVALCLRGVRPCLVDYVRWLLRRRGGDAEVVRMVPARLPAVLVQGLGVRAP